MATVIQWSVDDVKRWIHSWNYQYSVTPTTIHNVISCADIHRINGERLVYFTKDELKHCGLNKKDIDITIRCINKLVIGSYVDFVLKRSPKTKQSKQCKQSNKQNKLKLPPRPSDPQQTINEYDSKLKLSKQSKPKPITKVTKSQSSPKLQPKPKPNSNSNSNSKPTTSSTIVTPKSKSQTDSDDDWVKPITYPKITNISKSTNKKATISKQQQVRPSKPIPIPIRKSTNPFDTDLHSTSSTNPFNTNFVEPSTNPFDVDFKPLPQSTTTSARSSPNQAALQSVATNKDVHKATRSAMKDENIRQRTYNASKSGFNDPNANRKLVGALAQNKQVQSAAVSVAKDKKVQKAAYKGIRKNLSIKKAKKLLSFNM